MPLTLQYLKEQLEYEPEAGLFFWCINRKGRNMNKPVGSKTGVHGAPRITIDGVSYSGAQLAWFYMTGIWINIIGFRDLNTNNLKWSNLQHISKEEQSKRTKARVPNHEGIRGVVKNYATGEWYIQQMVNDKVVKGPYFTDPLEAINTWDKIDKAILISNKTRMRKPLGNTKATFTPSDVMKVIKEYIDH